MNFMEIAEKYSRGEILAGDERIEKAEKFLSEMASTEDGKQEIAEVIGMYIHKNFAKFDITPYICNSRHFRLGDKPEFRLKKKGIKAYFIAPNSYTPKSRNYQETLTMEFETVSVRPECFLDELKTGRIQGLADLIKDSRDAVKSAVAGKVFTILGQVYNNSSNAEMFDVCTTNLEQSALDTAIDTVFYKTGKKPVIIGDMMLCNQIMKFSGFTEEAREEIRQTGKLGTYRGATILSLPEIKDEATDKVLVPKDRLYIVSSEIGYSATYGEPKVGQETNIDDWSWNARIDKEFGLVVTDADGMFVIEIQ